MCKISAKRNHFARRAKDTLRAESGLTVALDDSRIRALSGCNFALALATKKTQNRFVDIVESRTMYPLSLKWLELL